MRRYSYVFLFAALLLILSAISAFPLLSSALSSALSSVTSFVTSSVSGATEDPAGGELPEDKYVRLMSAQSVQLIEIDGKTYRKAEGPARFLHNDTWLICDTALWSVDEQLIYAIGNVSIEQDETELRGDSLTYIIEENLATFRGHVVELMDKDGNILRTSNLDYNTKDSLAVFRGGGSMKDTKGQVIESMEGTYDSKAKLFTFRDMVDMFTDSVFIKTSLLFYNTDQEMATFPEYLEGWKEDKMLSAHQGWYKRNIEKFFFTDDVHTMSEEKEGWCDTLVFNKLENDVLLLGNAQVTDTTRNITSMGGYIHYTDSLSKLVLTQEPVVIMKLEDDDAYARADTIYYWTHKMCDIDTSVVAQARERKKQISVDPVANIRAKAAEELAKRIKEAEENDPNRPPQIPGPGAADGKNGPKGQGAGAADGKQGGKQGSGANAAGGSNVNAAGGKQGGAEHANVGKVGPGGSNVNAAGGKQGGGEHANGGKVGPGGSNVNAAGGKEGGGKQGGGKAAPNGPGVDTNPSSSSAEAPLDSAALALRDSIARADSIHIADSIAAIPPDTTKIGFMLAVHKVKMFRPKMQMICDSLIYSDLDSIARMFKSPVVWNENHQYNSDSLFIILDSGKMRKANLLSNAFVHIEEGEGYFDQIRSTEMMAYFNDSTQLSRFDALGSVSALFFFNEKAKIATANRKESSMLSAEFTGGQVTKISYYETPKSNAFPVAQMRQDEKKLKGFNWIKEQSPKSISDLTSRVPRASQRNLYEARPRTQFKQTNIYFPGYFDQVYKDIARADSLRRVAATRPSVRADSLVAGTDSLSAGVDSLAARADSLAAGVDSLAAGTSSLPGAAVGAAVGAAAARGSAAGEGPARGGPARGSAAMGGPAGSASSAIAGSLSHADSLALADSLARADSLAASMPQVPEGYVLVHPDDKTHKGTLWLGHVTVLDSTRRLANLDSLQLKLYIDSTSSHYHLPDTLPSALLLDTAKVFTSLDSAHMSLVIIALTEKEIQNLIAQEERDARRKAYEQKRAAALAEKEAKWKALDEKDAAKKAAKDAKKQEKERARQEKLLINMSARKAEEDALLEEYTRRYFEKYKKKAGL